ncbi:MAG TPA: outer membrane lipid asymmetry maintenance protein MlaD [Gammaproteobacteria bacterium]|nr:outer membrane lipid asymmetry maintenance protein MlaD [Gammaproteobacteria bacterium]
MYSRGTELSVGVFILLGALCLAFLALEVSGLTQSSDSGAYRLSARFDNVAGLTTRAKVSAAGVTVGRVVGIRYDEKTAGAIVEMEISQSFSQFSEDTSASILTGGLLGEKYIGLMTGGDPNNLADGDIIYDTQSAVILEELIGKFLLNMSSEK